MPRWEKETPDAAIGEDYNGYALVKGIFKKLLLTFRIRFAQILDLYENGCFTWRMAERIVHLSCAITDSEFWCDHLCVEWWPAKLRKDASYDPLTDGRFILVSSVLNPFSNVLDR